MAKENDENNVVGFEEMLISNCIQIDAIAQLLIAKGIITEQEYLDKLSEVQADYEILEQ